jgi:hypothetical protein
MSSLGIGLVLVLLVIAFAIGFEVGSGGMSWSCLVDAARKWRMRRQMVAVLDLLKSASKTLSVDDCEDALKGAERRIAALIAELQKGGDQKP